MADCMLETNQRSSCSRGVWVECLVQSLGYQLVSNACEGKIYFYSPDRTDQICGPRSLLFFTGVGEATPLGCHVNHSFPFSTEVNSTWSCISTSRMCLHGVCKSDDNFRFLFYLIHHKFCILLLENTF